MAIAETPHGTTARPANHTIHPGHAWILGLVVADDGSYVPPPNARGRQWPGNTRDGNAASATCTCPDPCELDHEYD